MPDDFAAALRNMQLRQWEMSEHARRWRAGEADDIRQFARDVRAVNSAWERLLKAGRAIVGGEADLGPDTIHDFAYDLERQADALDADAKSRGEQPLVWSPKKEEFL